MQACTDILLRYESPKQANTGKVGRICQALNLHRSEAQGASDLRSGEHMNEQHISWHQKFSNYCRAPKQPALPETLQKNVWLVWINDGETRMFMIQGHNIMDCIQELRSPLKQRQLEVQG